MPVCQFDSDLSEIRCLCQTCRLSFCLQALIQVHSRPLPYLNLKVRLGQASAALLPVEAVQMGAPVGNWQEADGNNRGQ